MKSFKLGFFCLFSKGYLTDSGEVELSRVQFILTGIGEVEDDIFKKRQRNEAEFQKRQKEKKKRMRMVNILLIYFLQIL